MIDGRGRLDDAVAKPDAAGALARGGQEDLRRRGMRVLLKEVVLYLPDIVDSRLVRQFDLLKRIGQQLVLVVGSPGPGQLMLVEDAEPHVSLLAGLHLRRAGRAGRSYRHSDTTCRGCTVVH